jgi:hypothetical protein
VTTYRELGERLGVTVCTDCSLTHHDSGFWADGRFHWRERALRRTSIRNFVWRIAADKSYRPVQPGETFSPAWLRYWRRVEWAKDALRTLKVRLPAPAWDQQRATLRALLAAGPARDFFGDLYEGQREVTRRAAVRWAKKPLESGDPAE